MKTVSSKRVFESAIQVPAGVRLVVPLAKEGLQAGYATIRGAARSDQECKLQIWQGLVGERWLAGGTEAETVTIPAAPLDEANDGAGIPFAADVVGSRYQVVLENPGNQVANVLLSIYLLGVA